MPKLIILPIVRLPASLAQQVPVLFKVEKTCIEVLLNTRAPAFFLSCCSQQFSLQRLATTKRLLLVANRSPPRFNTLVAAVFTCRLRILGFFSMRRSYAPVMFQQGKTNGISANMTACASRDVGDRSSLMQAGDGSNAIARHPPTSPCPGQKDHEQEQLLAFSMPVPSCQPCVFFLCVNFFV